MRDFSFPADQLYVLSGADFFFYFPWIVILFSSFFKDINRIVDNSLYDTKLSSKYTSIWVEEKCYARVVLDRIIQSHINQIAGGYALFFTINCNLLVPNYLSNDQIFIMLDSPIDI